MFVDKTQKLGMEGRGRKIKQHFASDRKLLFTTRQRSLTMSLKDFQKARMDIQPKSSSLFYLTCNECEHKWGSSATTEQEHCLAPCVVRAEALGREGTFTQK